MRTLNVRLAATLLTIFVVLSVGVHFLHKFQLKRNAFVFKDQAERDHMRMEEAAKAKDEAAEKTAYKSYARNLQWYIQLAPDEIEVVQELGMLLADKADDSRTFSQAFGCLERVVRQEPENKPVRRRLVDMAMMSRRLSDAKEHLEQFLLVQSPDDPELWDLLGQCNAEGGDYEEALKNFQKAISLSPKQLQAYPRIATILRFHFSREKEADQWMDKLVKANPNDAMAHYLRGNYLKSFGLDAEARKEAMKSLELKKDNRDGLWLAAQCCLSDKEYDQARKYCERSIELYPKSVVIYTTLADVELRAGNRDKAVAALENGLKVTLQNPQLLFALCNVLIDVDRPKDAEKRIEELRKTEYPKPMIDYLIARKEFVQGHWYQARLGFEKCRGVLMNWPNLLKQVDVWIGQCYRQLGNREQEQAAYRRALKIDPFYLPARAGLMDAMMATGEVDSALSEYEQQRKLGKLGPNSLIPYARMVVQQTMKQPSSKQDWTKAKAVLEEAEKHNPDAVQIPMLRAEILVAQEKLAEAEALLENARRKNPGYAGLWAVLASLAERQKNWEKAERLLEEAQRNWGDTVPQRLALAQLLSKRHGKRASDRLRKLAENIDQFSQADQIQLWAGLVNAAAIAEDNEFVKELCHKIAKREPNNVQVRFVLFEQAVRAEDDAGMVSMLKEIDQVAGQGAFWLYGQAVRLSIQAKKEKDGKQEGLLKEALGYLGRAKELRQGWSRIPLLTAGIYDQMGDVDEALKNYQEAIDMGEREPAAIQRTVQILTQKQRNAEADRLLQHLGEQKVALTNDLNRASTEAALRNGNVARALELAKKAVPADSKNVREHIWLGQVYNMIGRKFKTDGQAKKAKDLAADAEKSLRLAVKLDPKSPECWIALIQFLNTNDKDDEAERLVEEVGKNVPAKDAVLAVAQCYEVLDKMDAAEQKYEAAQRAAPNDIRVLRAAADFYARVNKSVAAEAILRQIIDGKVKAEKGDVAWARRQMAILASAKGGYQNIQKARALVDKNLQADKESVLDRRILASLDATDPDRSRRDEAIRTLEKLLEDQSASTEDRFRLAQMYRSSGAWTQASTMFRKLIADSANDPRYLAIYVAALVEHGELTNADAYLGRLEAAVPNHFNTVSLRAEVLVAKGEPQKALDLLTEFVDRVGARPPEKHLRVRLVSEKLEQLARQLNTPQQKAMKEQFVRKAEMYCRVFLDTNPEKSPAQSMILVGFLARQGKTDSALDLLQANWERSNPTVISQIVSLLLRDDKITTAQMGRLDDILKQATKRFDRPAPLMMIMAELYTKLGRYEDAEKCYRDVLKKAPSNAFALNNLAVLLALQGIKLEDSLQLIAKAVEIAGPVGAMLDSRASVYLAKGETDKALSDMNEALTDAETPVRYFHQAMVYDRAGKADEAKDAMQKAIKRGLTKEMLHPLEFKAFEKLQAAAK
jgi:tetratricopeptide (TPR) repeat protein